MSVLKSLKLTSAAPTSASADPKQRVRDKVVQSLAEQREAIAAKLEGRHYQPTHLVTRKNDAGERVRVEAPRRIRRGWFQDASGKVFFSIRYGGKPVELAKDKNAIEVGSLEALPGIIDTLIQAVQAGELDEPLMAAAEERGQLLRKRAS